MKKIVYSLALLLLLGGCATINGAQEVKKMREDKGCKNMASVDIKKTVDEAKEIVRKAAREMNLAENTKEETKGFLYCEAQTFWGRIASIFSEPKAARYGFFFEPDSSGTMTTVTIVENTSGKAKRDTLAAKIKELAM